MQIEAVRDAIDVRVGSRFGAPDVRRVQDAVAALGPCSRLTIDFTAARECDDAALVLLASMLGCLSHGEVAVKGLSRHHWRLLTYLGLFPNLRHPPRAVAPRLPH